MKIISDHLVERLNKILLSSRDNAHALLVEHDAALGRTTDKNRLIAEEYEKEIKDIDSALSELANSNESNLKK